MRLFVFFNDTATTEIYTLSLHDALPIWRAPNLMKGLIRRGVLRRLPAGYDVDTHFGPLYDPWDQRMCFVPNGDLFHAIDRKSTRLNSSHANISYAVFCLKKKKIKPPARF